MQYSEDFFLGINNLKIYYQIFKPDNPKCVIQISHGFCEHSGRYKKLIDELVANNFAVFINDHQGHGKSEGIRNHTKSFDDYMEDVHTVTLMIKEIYPELPIFLIGHSMGSFVAQRYAIKYQEDIQGMILSGSGTRVKELPRFIKIMARVIAKILPTFKADTGLDPDGISSDPESVDAYRNDPLIDYKISTAITGVCFMNHYKEIKDKIGLISIPVLFQKGELDDMILDIEAFMEELKTDDKQVIVYENAKHEVYTETKEKREKAFSDLVNWINSHI